MHPVQEGEKVDTHHTDKTVERHKEEKAGHPIERTQTLKKKLMPMRFSPKSLNTTTQSGPRAVYSPREKQLGHFHRTLIFFAFSPVSSTSQYCLSQFTHQILYTNIERVRR